ncbi:MAG TPA: DUF3352 domain-containing protein [Jatrophihabitans sp.]|nr:DUF3352 domain-containing protein [Jatrophihabitans sp.]
MTEPTDHDHPSGPEQEPGWVAGPHPYGGPPAYPGWDQPPFTELPASGEFDGSWPEGGGWAGGVSVPGHPAPGHPYPGQPGGYQPGGYPSGGYPAPPPGYPQPGFPQPRRRFRLILASVAAVLLLVVGGVAAAAYEVLNGGGTQPDAVVPAAAVAFVKLDLDPSAQQKVGAARFLHRLPKVGAGFTSSADWRRAIFQAFSGSGSMPAGVDYDRDIKPWLGKRMAVALLPTSGNRAGGVLLILQCTDEAKARTGIARFAPARGVSFSKGYAIVAPSQQAADRMVADAETANLAGSDHYRSDMKRLGGLGVLSGWADTSSALQFIGGVQPDTSGGAPAGSERLAFTLRLQGNWADLTVKITGGTAQPIRPAESLGSLPATTAAAASLAYDASKIETRLQDYDLLLGSLPVAGKALAEGDPLTTLADRYGLSVPADLSTLLGTGVRASVDGDGLDSDNPKYAVHSSTDGAAATRVMDRIRAAAGGSLPFTYRSDSTGFAVGSDAAYLAKVSAGSGPTLSSRPEYRQALPDASGAGLITFVDFDAVRRSLARSGTTALDHLESFRSAGLTVGDVDGTPTVHLRLLAH